MFEALCRNNGYELSKLDLSSNNYSIKSVIPNNKIGHVVANIDELSATFKFTAIKWYELEHAWNQELKDWQAEIEANKVQKQLKQDYKAKKFITDKL